MRVKMVFGEPMYFQGPEKAASPEELRKATDQIMKKLQDMSGQEYVDIYASQAKEAIAEEKRRNTDQEDEE